MFFNLLFFAISFNLLQKFLNKWFLNSIFIIMTLSCSLESNSFLYTLLLPSSITLLNFTLCGTKLCLNLSKTISNFIVDEVSAQHLCYGTEVLSSNACGTILASKYLGAELFSCGKPQLQKTMAQWLAPSLPCHRSRVRSLGWARLTQPFIP